MSSRREFLLTMLLVPLGLRLPKDLSLSVNSQVPCWDCGEVLFDDEQEAREVAAGLQCWTCFYLDTGELRKMLTTVARKEPFYRL